MATNYGQPPHFDLTKPLFAPLQRIEYGESDGTKRHKLAIRRYTYKYINNNFVFFKTYKGVRQRHEPRITSVVDAEIVNLKNAAAVETLEGAPEFNEFLTQNLLKNLFAFPNSDGLFFIEGEIRKRYYPAISYFEFEGSAPNWFDIYRYGKIVNNQIVILKESEETITKNG